MEQTKRCSRCSVVLDDSTSSPSTQRKGGYCRPCAADYMREYKPGKCVICGARASSGYMRCQLCAAQARRRPRTIRTQKPQLRLDPKTGRPSNTKAWKTLRRSVIDEETHCGICGEMVDKTLSGNTALGPSLDHAIPMSLGGHPFDRTNLRLAHTGCNSRGGNVLTNPETTKVLRLALALAAAGL